MRYDNGKFVSNPGSPIKVTYEPKVLPSGEVVVVESGKENFDAYIQSFAESCDIEFMVKRFLNGDTSVLTTKQPIFGDFTNMPKTFAEVLQVQIDSANSFAKLPAEVKKKFDNDANRYFASAGTPEWFEKLGVLSFDKVNDSVESEVKSDES